MFEAFMILSNKFDYKAKVCLQSDKIISLTKPYIVKMLHNESFRTQINPLFFQKKINFKSKLMNIGSCFAQNIGNKLLENRFDITINPYGVLYNPLTIFENLKNAIKNPTYVDEEKIIENEKIFKHFDYHSDISDLSKDALIQKILSIQKDTSIKLKKVDYIFITLGTSFIFNYKKNNTIVGNCHKIPAKEFSQEIASIDSLIDSFEQLHSLLPKDTQIIFTVSPIRHFRNGLVDNNLSKSILRYFVHLMTEKYQNCLYFPAFEILNDELRDYRFYADDMVHPSSLAKEYIWSYFDDALIDPSTLQTRKVLDKILKGINHKPFNADSVPHQKFLKKLLVLTQSIKEIEVDDLKLIIKQKII